MHFTIIPYNSVGKLELGMNIDDVHEIFMIDFKKEFTNVPKLISESNLKVGIRVEYEDEKCIVIELLKPAKAIYKNMDLFTLTYKEILSFFASTEKNFYTDGAVLLLIDIGLGFYFQNIDSESLPQTISVFCKGGYDEFLHMFQKIEIGI